MGMIDRRFLAALFFCALALSSCAEKRAVMERPSVEIAPSGEPPAVEPRPGAPVETPGAGTEEGSPEVLRQAPLVRVLVCNSAQAVRVRIPSAFRAGGDAAGEPLASVEHGGDFSVRAVGGEAVLSEGRRKLVSSAAVLVRPEGDAFVSINGKPYRGDILFRAAGASIMTINVLDIDDYIRGVLPSEIGYLKPNQLEAYRAQAIAARSYALSKLEEKRGELYDLNATVMDQVYGGAGCEHGCASDAVDDTRGLVCAFLGEPIKAYYCACCGGHTGDIRTDWPWKTPMPYLYGVRDTVPGSGGESLCRGSKHFRWRVHWSASDLTAVLRRTIPKELRVSARGVGRLSDIRVMGTGHDGRVIGIEIETDRESFEVLGDRIRWVLRPDPDSDAILRSTLFEIDVSGAGGKLSAVDMLGGGNGHGIGMCQSGAIRMAELGYSGEDILAHYYPGTRVERWYR
jgi:stage II sporulation protein D